MVGNPTSKPGGGGERRRLGGGGTSGGIDGPALRSAILEIGETAVADSLGGKDVVTEQSGDGHLYPYNGGSPAAEEGERPTVRLGPDAVGPAG